MRVRVPVLVAVLVLAADALVAIGMAPAGATTLVANETQFRNAWMDPNETQIDLANDVTFATPCSPPGTAIRSSTNALIVDGHGHTLTLCAASGNGVLNQSSTGALTFQNITVTRGTATGLGGAIHAQGAVTVTNSAFTNNTADDDGGAIFAGPAVTVTNSTFTNNTAPGGLGGGAIFGQGVVMVTNSTFTTNTAANGGGAINAVNGAVTVTNSTFSTNTATGINGGAILAGDAMTVKNSTFSTNTAGHNGGAIFASGAMTVAYSTLTGNAAPLGSASFSNTTIASFGSVFMKPAGTGALCGVSVGPATSAGYNFANETANSCALTATGDSSLDANNPLLGALANNGGPTQTQLPQDGPSPLIDAIPNAACQTAPLATGISTDQRALVRPEQTGGKCDIGAVEVQLPPAAPAAVIVTPRFTG